MEINSIFYSINKKILSRKEERTISKKESPSRTRNYATIVYPESAPENWREILADLHIPVLISPLHDKDVTPDGEIKKAHYHVIIMYGGVKTTAQAEAIIKKIGGVGVVPINHLPAYARYLIHLDDPDKAQYDVHDVTALSGADYDAITYIPADDLSCIVDMLQFINVNQISSFSVFADYMCIGAQRMVARTCTQKNIILFLQYLKSATWTESLILDKEDL